MKDLRVLFAPAADQAYRASTMGDLANALSSVG
jgi:hypothetical protein